MRILAAVAVLLGLVSAKTNLKDISGSYQTATGIVDPFFDWTFSLDYSTVYNTGADSTSDFILFESYEINAASSATASVGLTFFSGYEYGIELDLTIFDITPYRQFIQWVNPIAILTGDATEFDIGIRGEYDLYFAEIAVNHLQSFWELSYDLASWIQTTIQGTTTVSDLVPTTSDWAFTEVDFTSSILAFDPSDYLGSWYGNQAYYQTSLNGYITANV